MCVLCGSNRDDIFECMWVYFDELINLAAEHMTVLLPAGSAGLLSLFCVFVRLHTVLLTERLSCRITAVGSSLEFAA